MKILYFLSLLLFFYMIFIIKKTKKKQNLILGIIYSFLSIFFYNLIIALFLSILNIDNSLLNFSFVYIISTIIIYYYFKKKYKKIIKQEYYFDRKEIIYLLFIIIICFAIGIVRYSSSFDIINYEIGDSAVHYKMSLEYSAYEKVFFNYNKNVIVDYNYPMFGYYVNCGIFMKLMPFSKIVSYNLFNTIILLLVAICFYLTLLSIKKSKGNNFFTFIFVMLYILAYPLNFMFYGFGYLGIGILAVNLIILTFNYINENGNNILYLLLFLYNFGLFCSYYLFVPVVYISEFIYLLYLFKKKKYNIKRRLSIIFISLMIPSFFGYMFFISSSSVSSAIKSYSITGESYQSLINNFILIIPLLCYSVFKQAKRNVYDFDLIFLICLILYVLVTFILIGFNLVSSYYYYKAYYILWLIVNIFVYKLINYKDSIVILKIQYLFIIMVIFFSFYDIEKSMSKINSDFQYSGVLKKIEDVYVYNNRLLLKPSIHITPDRLKLIMSPKKFSNECWLEKKYITLPYISTYYQKFWYFSLNEFTTTKDYDNYLAFYGMKNDSGTVKINFRNDFGVTDYVIDEKNYSAFLEYDNLKCLLVDNEAIGHLKEHKFSADYDILFENKTGKLYKKKSVNK